MYHITYEKISDIIKKENKKKIMHEGILKNIFNNVCIKKSICILYDMYYKVKNI